MADYRDFFAAEAKEHEKMHARWKATADKETSSTEKKYGVGCDIIEHVPPQDTHDVSATKIREQMKQEGKL